MVTEGCYSELLCGNGGLLNTIECQLDRVGWLLLRHGIGWDGRRAATTLAGSATGNYKARQLARQDNRKGSRKGGLPRRKRQGDHFFFGLA